MSRFASPSSPQSQVRPLSTDNFHRRPSPATSFFFCPPFASLLKGRIYGARSLLAAHFQPISGTQPPYHCRQRSQIIGTYGSSWLRIIARPGACLLLQPKHTHCEEVVIAQPLALVCPASTLPANFKERYFLCLRQNRHPLIWNKYCFSFRTLHSTFASLQLRHITHFAALELRACSLHPRPHRSS